MEKAWKCRLASGMAVLAIAGVASMAAFAEGPNAGLSAENPSDMVTAEESGSSVSDHDPGGETAMETAGNTSAEEDSHGTSTEEDTDAVDEGRSDDEGTRAPEGESIAEEGDSQDQTDKESQTAAAEVSEEDIDAYFDGTVLIGDSVMLGFRNYALNRSGTYLGRIQFLASGSFSVHNALWPVSAKSVHPIYQGQKRLVWESVGMIQPRRVFMFFGLNDMNMGSLEDTCAKYAQVIANIKTTCPDVEVHIMSMTYTLRGRGKGRLNNENIRQFNNMLRQMAWDNGWGFVDIANPLADANGDLAPAYCSDNYVHQTSAAYDVWSAVLRTYARSHLEGTTDFPVQSTVIDEKKDGNYGMISVPYTEPPETAAETEESNTEENTEN